MPQLYAVPAAEAAHGTSSGLLPYGPLEFQSGRAKCRDAARADRSASTAKRTSLHHLPHDFLVQFCFRYLERHERQALSHVDRRLHRTLDSLLAEEQIRAHIPLAVTLTGLKRLLTRVFAARPTSHLPLLELLAESLPSLPPSHFVPAAKAILAELRRMEQDEEKAGKGGTNVNVGVKGKFRANAIGKWARMLGPTVVAPGCPRDERLPLEQYLWKEVRDLPPQTSGEPIGILLEQGADNLIERREASQWLSGLAQLPPGGRSAMLSGLARSWRAVISFHCLDRGSEKGVQSWRLMFNAAMELAPGYSERPLGDLAASARRVIAAQPQIWEYLLETASKRSLTERAAIYGGMTAVIQVLPSDARRAAFDQLWTRAMALPVHCWPQLLDRFAVCSIELGLYRYQNIVAASLALPESEPRLVPVQTILRSCRRRFFSLRNSVCEYVISQMQSLTTPERAQLLGDCAACVDTNDALRPILAIAASLPADLRRLTAAGLASNYEMAHVAGGSRWIDDVVMPMIATSGADDRADTLLNLARHAFHDSSGSSKSPKLMLSEPTWNLINQYIDALSVTLQANLLKDFISGLSSTETPAWKWAMRRTMALPRGYQPKLIYALLKPSDMLEGLGKVTAVHRLLPAIFALPAFYRALPYKAVSKAMDEINAWDNISGYWCAMFHMLRLKASLPYEDSKH